MDDVTISVIEKNSREALHVSLRVWGRLQLAQDEPVESRRADGKGHVFCDVRLHWLPVPGGEWKATHKGCTVRLDKLAELRQALDDAEAEARRLGLLPE